METVTQSHPPYVALLLIVIVTFFAQYLFEYRCLLENKFVTDFDVIF